MGISCIEWKILRDHASAGRSLLSLGYPDLLVPDQEIEAAGIALPPERVDSGRVAERHAWNGIVRETSPALVGLGYVPTYVDVANGYGVDQLIDLNLPLMGRDESIGKFDVVCDFGTLEHCFNIGQAFENVASAVAPGGLVLHRNPANMINHGYWSFGPGVYFDYWTSRGGEVLELFFSITDENGQHITRCNKPEKRFKAQSECLLHAVIRAPSQPTPALWPVQRKYV